MAGLKEVAAASGVSIRTVMRALSGQGYIDSQTRERVVTQAQRLGYRPNLAARSLKTARSFDISVVAWSMDELHIAKIAGLEQTLRHAGYAVNVLLESAANTGGDWLENVLLHRPAGVALFSSSQFHNEQALRLLDSKLPYIVFDAPTGPLDSVRIDRQQGVYEAVLYLAAKGRRAIAYLGTQADRSRLDGYLRALGQLSRRPIYIEQEEGDQYAAGIAASQRFSELPKAKRPDAVLAYADEVGLGFMAGLHERGIRIPSDVAVIGFDDRRAAALSWPRLTTVAQPSRELGIAAAEILLRKIKGEVEPSTGWSRTMPTKLVLRESA